MFTIDKIYQFSLFGLIVSLSFSSALPNLFLGLSLVLFIFKLIKKEFNFTVFRPIIAFSFLLCYLFLKQLVVTDFNFEDANIVSRFLIVLILPIIIPVESKNKTAVAIVTAAILAMFIALFNTLSYFLIHKNVPFENGEIVNKLLVIDRPYLGFLSLIAIVICFYLIKQFPKYKIVLGIISFALFVFIVFIVARLSLLSAILIGFIYLLFYSDFSIFKKSIVLLSIISLICLLLFSYKNLFNRVFTNTTVERLKLYDPRVDIWDCAYRISQDQNFNPIIGAKSHQVVSDQLVDCYKTKNGNDLRRRQWFIDTRFNTHNQFIDFYLVGGVVGLLLFIYFLFEMIRGARNNFYSFSLVIALVLFLFFENVFQRQLGCFLIAIILYFSINRRTVSNSKTIANIVSQ